MTQKSSLSFLIIEEPFLWVERKAEEAERQSIYPHDNNSNNNNSKPLFSYIDLYVKLKTINFEMVM